MASILIVEDDHSLALGLIYALEKEGYVVTHCKRVADALAKIDTQHFDLVLLDMQLPDGLGKEIGQKLISRHTPLIYLTIVDDEDEIVQALEDGASDYITKPFRMRELLARIKKALSHTPEGWETSQFLRIGNAVIDRDAGKVFMENQLIPLTALEYRLLLIFAENQSILLTRDLLLQRIWDISGDFVEDNTLTVYVKRLRQKRGDGVHFTTVRGIGYRVDQ